MSFKSLFQKEDYWAIWIAGSILIITLLLFAINKPKEWFQIDILEDQIKLEEKAPFKTTFWYQSIDDQQKIKGSNTPIGKILKRISSKPAKWETNPLEAFYLSDIEAESKKG